VLLEAHPHSARETPLAVVAHRNGALKFTGAPVVGSKSAPVLNQSHNTGQDASQGRAAESCGSGAPRTLLRISASLPAGGLAGSARSLVPSPDYWSSL